MEDLYRRGARNFKFIDRTFNLKVSTSIAILEFFLERMDDDLYLHFEVIPDHLPQKLKQVLARFPSGSLQFEIGVQSFDPEIQQTISRKQSNEKTCANLQWLREHTGAHIHADLIFAGEFCPQFRSAGGTETAGNPAGNSEAAARCADQPTQRCVSDALQSGGTVQCAQHS
jgi:hypothetical protein